MPSDKMYPEGRGGIKSRYSGTALIFFDGLTGVEQYRIDTTVTGGLIVPGVERNVRTRVAVGTINAGASSLIAALTGFKIRLIGIRAISVGGAVGATTTVDVLGVQATASVKLTAFAQASLTQSAVLTAGGTGATALADGASFVANDVSTAITVSKTGASLTVATHVDFLLSFVYET